MNNENLKPIQKGQLSKEEAKRRGRKGGLASAKARRRKKTASAIMRDVLDQKLSEGKLLDNLRDAGFDVDGAVTVGTAYVYSVLKSAMDGNAQAMRIVLDMVGENQEFNHKIEMDKEAMKLREREVKAKEEGW